MRPPIIVADGLDLRIFRTRRDAELGIDAREAVGDAVRAWDAEGGRLRVDVGDAVCLDAARVTVSARSAGAGDEPGLRRCIRESLSALGDPPPSDASLADLLERALARVGFAG